MGLSPKDILELSLNLGDNKWRVPTFALVGWLLFTITIVVTISTQMFGFLAGFLLYRLIDWTVLIVIGHDIGLTNLMDVAF